MMRKVHITLQMSQEVWTAAGAGMAAGVELVHQTVGAWVRCSRWI